MFFKEKTVPIRSYEGATAFVSPRQKRVIVRGTYGALQLASDLQSANVLDQDSHTYCLRYIYDARRVVLDMLTFGGFSNSDGDLEVYNSGQWANLPQDLIVDLGQELIIDERKRTLFTEYSYTTDAMLPGAGDNTMCTYFINNLHYALQMSPTPQTVNFSFVRIDYRLFTAFQKRMQKHMELLKDEIAQKLNLNLKILTQMPHKALLQQILVDAMSLRGSIE